MKTPGTSWPLFISLPFTAQCDQEHLLLPSFLLPFRQINPDNFTRQPRCCAWAKILTLPVSAGDPDLWTQGQTHRDKTKKQNRQSIMRHYEHNYLFGDLAGIACSDHTVVTVSSPSPALPPPPLLLRRYLLCPSTPSPPRTRWFHAGARRLIILKGFVALSRACVLKTYISLTNCGGIKADLWGFKRSQEGRVWNPLSVLLQSGYISSYAAFHTTLPLRDFF